jgi:hypothetical protein
MDQLLQKSGLSSQSQVSVSNLEELERSLVESQNDLTMTSNYGSDIRTESCAEMAADAGEFIPIILRPLDIPN